jgi:hypothetical protein
MSTFNKNTRKKNQGGKMRKTGVVYLPPKNRVSGEDSCERVLENPSHREDFEQMLNDALASAINGRRR